MLTQQCRHVGRRSHSHRADQVVRLEFLKRTFRVAESPCWVLIQAHTLATPLLIVMSGTSRYSEKKPCG
jgi:hypothetical protein